jgi:DNA-binding NtrC family response regulator
LHEIDDEPDVRLSLRMRLEAMDWTVLTAAGLATALAELARGFAPDAIVVDFRLQGDLNGTEVVSELHAAGRRVPAVIVTGDTAPDRMDKLMRSGLPVLHKPVQGERLVGVLLDAIANQIGSSGKRREEERS